MEQFETLKQGEAPQAKTGNNSGYINLITDQLTVNMYPSPVKEVSNVTLSINNKTIKNLNLKLFNLQGALLFEDDINTSEDSFDYKLPVIQLDGGIYYLMIGNRNAIVTKKLIVLD
ncbi:MAG: T9SS type A sorting domain-containing protein [Bacteroidia bacterium]|nr:T9SS type A sorting domain-containing protein [Bacteroidia bacterium]